MKISSMFWIMPMAFFCVTATALANDAPPSSPSANSPEIMTSRPHSKWSLGAEASEQSRFSAGVSYSINPHWSLVLLVGHMADHQQISAGGDLQAWQYIEEDKSFESSFARFGANYYLKPNEGSDGWFAGFALGQTILKTSYTYARYKPYNGAICFLSCPDKVVEASQSQYGSISTLFAAAHLGYAFVPDWWIFGSKQMRIALSIEYLYFPQQSQTLQAVKSADVGTEMISPWTGTIDLVFTF